MAWLTDISEEIADEFASAQSRCSLALTYSERRSMQSFEPVKPWDIGRLKEWIAKHPEKRKLSTKEWAQRNRVKGRPLGRQPVPPDRVERRNKRRRALYAERIEVERQKTIARMRNLFARKKAEAAALGVIHKQVVRHRSYSSSILACVAECPGITGASIHRSLAPSVPYATFVTWIRGLVRNGDLTKHRANRAAPCTYELSGQLALSGAA